jgi:hypothetical protein
MKLADRSTGRVCAPDYKQSVKIAIRSMNSVRGVDLRLAFAVFDALNGHQSALDR